MVSQTVNCFHLSRRLQEISLNRNLLTYVPAVLIAHVFLENCLSNIQTFDFSNYNYYFLYFALLIARAFLKRPFMTPY